MVQRIKLHLFLLCVWCFVRAPWMTATEPPTATACIATPERDQRIGGRVEMRCVATNLEENHIVAWRTENLTLRWGDATVGGNDPRFMFDTKQTGIREITQGFNITNLQWSDENEYFCNVYDPLPHGGSRTVANSTIRLRVYSSNESFPVCSPEGSITVDADTRLNIRCSVNTSNTNIKVIGQPMMSNSYAWVLTTSNRVSTLAFDLIPDVNDDNLTFVCTVPSMTFPGVTHSCFIGPFRVLAVSVSPTTKRTILPNPTTSPESEITSVTRGTMIIEPCLLTPWIVAFVVAFALLALSCVIIILLILHIYKQRRLINSLTEKTSTQVPKFDPYTELHPTDDSNTAYTEPVTKGSTSTRHTYYNTLDIENEKTADDYEQPEDKYEAVGTPKNDENNV